MKLGAIDVGSHSVRLLMREDGVSLYKKVTITRLAEGLAERGELAAEAMERTVRAVADFAEEARLGGADKVAVFATEAVRSAKNGSEFSEKVRRAAGVAVDVLNGKEEAEIGLLGALGDADGCLVDLGGGSCEVIVRLGGKIAYEKSVPVGVVRLLDLCGQDPEALGRYISARLREYGDVPAAGKYVAVGGTATSLAALDLGLKEYDPALVHGHSLALGRLERLSQMLLGKTVEERKALPGVDPRRAEVLGGGSLFLVLIARFLGADAFVVSEADNLEGYAMRSGG